MYILSIYISELIDSLQYGLHYIKYSSNLLSISLVEDETTSLSTACIKLS